MKTRSIFRTIAALLVTTYAARIYDKARKTADKRHMKEKTTIYVIVDPMNIRGLATCSRKEFRRMNELLRRRTPSFSVSDMRRGAYYHTADAGESHAMPDIDIRARRIAFIREMLVRAGLR